MNGSSPRAEVASARAPRIGEIAGVALPADKLAESGHRRGEAHVIAQPVQRSHIALGDGAGDELAGAFPRQFVAHFKEGVFAAVALGGFGQGWKLNADAPSYLAVFTGEDNTLLAQYTREQLRAGARLPALKAGQRYILQGTLYYCEDKEGSVCLIKSVEQPLHAEEGGEDAIIVPVR